MDSAVQDLIISETLPSFSLPSQLDFAFPYLLQIHMPRVAESRHPPLRLIVKFFLLCLSSASFPRHVLPNSVCGGIV